MAIVKMKKLSLSLATPLREPVFRDLQEAGCVHLQPAVADTEPQPGISAIQLDDLETSELLGGLEDSIEFLQTHLPPVKAGMLDSLAAVPPARTLRELEELYRSFPLEEVIRDIRSLEQEYRDTESRIQALTKEEADLRVWQKVGLDLDSLHGNNPFTGTLAGYIPKDSLPRFIAEIAEVTPYAEVLTADQTPNEVYVSIVFARSEEQAVRDRVRELSFASVPVSERSGQLEQALEHIRADIRRLRSRLELSRMLIVDLACHLEDLQALFDLLHIYQQGREAQGQGLQTGSVSFYLGWVPEPRVSEIQAILARYAELDYTLSDPQESEYEEVPVLLENKKVFSPFEPLTRMFGLPMYGSSVDPTPHLSPFYFIFYGFCLGDFFYGLLMLGLFGFLGWKSRKNPGTSAFMTMLALAGLSSMLFGVVFGSYLGDLFSVYIQVPFLKNAGLINTLEKPMLVLYIALIMGAVHLLYGLVLNMVHKMRSGFWDSLFDNFPWIVFLSGGFAWATLSWIGSMVQLQDPAFFVPPASVTRVFFIIIAAGAGLIILNSIRKALKKGPAGLITGLFGGLWELYGATGYLSDLLSYARLLALGLATGVIANVFNFLALGMGAPLILGVVILLIGHVFNLVLSAFGAFVHSLRLQFVEFFSKFMESGGREFRPLQREGQFNQIIKE